MGVPLIKDEVRSHALDAHAEGLRRRLAEADAAVVIHAGGGVSYLVRAAS